MNTNYSCQNNNGYQLSMVFLIQVQHLGLVYVVIYPLTAIHSIYSGVLIFLLYDHLIHMVYVGLVMNIVKKQNLERNKKIKFIVFLFNQLTLLLECHVVIYVIIVFGIFCLLEILNLPIASLHYFAYI